MMKQTPIVEELNAAADDVWGKLFTVCLSYKATLNNYDLKTSGTFTYGNKRLDDQYLNEKIVTMLNVDKMIEHYRIGNMMTFPNSHEVGEIYAVVNRYLQGYANLIENTIVQHEVPADDLMLMDRFAAEIKQQYHLFGPEPTAPKVSDIFRLLTTPLVHVESNTVSDGVSSESEGHQSRIKTFGKSLFELANKPGKSPTSERLWK
jgi:hypothetical protein